MRRSVTEPDALDKSRTEMADDAPIEMREVTSALSGTDAGDAPDSSQGSQVRTRRSVAFQFFPPSQLFCDRFLTGLGVAEERVSRARSR